MTMMATAPMMSGRGRRKRRTPVSRAGVGLVIMVFSRWAIQAIHQTLIMALERYWCLLVMVHTALMGASRWIAGKAGPIKAYGLHCAQTHDMEAVVHIHNVSGDRTCGWRKQIRGDITNIALLDVTPQRSHLLDECEHVVDVANATGG